MNKRIRELYLQAHNIRHYDNDPSLAGNPPTVYWQGEVSAQRFAELIVRECAEVVQEGRWMVPPSQEQLARSIKQHFGVE